MNKILFLIMVILSLQGYSQSGIKFNNDHVSERFALNIDKKLERYDLKHLNEMGGPALRIWNNTSIITLAANSQMIMLFRKGDTEVVRDTTFKNRSNLNEMISEIKAFSGLESNMIRGIDNVPTTIELFSPVEGYTMMSYYNNSEVREILKQVFEENQISEMRDQVIQKLPSGNYGYGQTGGLRIDHLITAPSKQSVFYKKVLAEMHEKLNLDTNTRADHMPLVLINKEISNLESLNKLVIEEVEDYTIMAPAMSMAIYGSSGKNGAIVIKTK